MTYHEGRSPGPGSGTGQPFDPATPAAPETSPTGGSAPDAAQGVRERVSTTVDAAKEEASKVTGEARRQLHHLTGRTRDEATSQARQQKDRAVSGLRTMSEELRSMSDHSSQPGMAGDLVREAAGRADDFAGWLDGREPGELIEEVRAFASRRPGMFLALAVGAGVLAGRLTRGMARPTEQDASS
ncbi:hypothetical protein E1262_14160 [Jiangella aurantiaca]|uniref:Uncharacterized protein n=1 Tax=Jiangella aurantiaca TaxID=2530373 RepID=A0A4R5ACU0_9ACTN|nr:hypothetical protein [Jiangella aurantiaca]TDD68889.1 hypothetical protein E1262_14160 [Jiangella aurantiaca]